MLVPTKCQSSKGRNYHIINTFCSNLLLSPNKPTKFRGPSSDSCQDTLLTSKAWRTNGRTNDPKAICPSNGNIKMINDELVSTWPCHCYAGKRQEIGSRRHSYSCFIFSEKIRHGISATSRRSTWNSSLIYSEKYNINNQKSVVCYKCNWRFKG